MDEHNKPREETDEESKERVGKENSPSSLSSKQPSSENDETKTVDINPSELSNIDQDETLAMTKEDTLGQEGSDIKDLDQTELVKPTDSLSPSGEETEAVKPRILATKSKKTAKQEPKVFASKPKKEVPTTEQVVVSKTHSPSSSIASFTDISGFFGRTMGRFTRSLADNYEAIRPSFLWLLLLFISITSLFYFSFIMRIELLTFDFRMKLRKFVPQVDYLSVIEIQDECIREIGDWPWNRNIHAAQIKILKELFQPYSIAFDVLFLESSEKVLDLPTGMAPKRTGKYDKVFSLLIRKSKNIFLASNFEFSKDESLTLEERVDYYSPPYEDFARGAKGVGHISYEVDLDGSLRRIPLVIRHEGRWVPHLSLQVVLDYLGLNIDDINIVDGIKILIPHKKGDIEIPVDKNNQMIISWPGDFEESFNHFGYRDVRQAKAAKNFKEINSRISMDALKNHIVFVGFTATGLLDYKETPISKEYPLVGAQMAAVNQILTGNFIHTVPPWVNYLMTLILATLMGYVALFYSPKRGLIMLGFLSISVVFFGVSAFLYSNLWVEMARPLISIWLTGLVLGSYSHIRFKDHVDLKLSFEQKLNMADAKLPQFRPNLKIGPYKNIKELGRGGMAIVYRGLGKDGQEYAIKVINPEFLSRQGFKYRFKREIMTMRKVFHPNVIRVYDSGTYQGILYYAMELFEAGDLGDHLDRLHRSSDWKWVGEFFCQLIDGLMAIHTANLIHRDIKPANIMMNDQNQVKLADFGLARREDEGQLLTTVGQVLGTPAYLAPELCKGDSPSYSADIYAMGIIFYEILSGTRPFQDCQTMAALMQAKLKSPIITVQAKRKDCPTELCTIVDKMVAHNPLERYQTCQDVMSDLQQAISSI